MKSTLTKRLKTKLLPFQKEGVLQLERFDGRALLADDMGLGKTLQFLAWLNWNRKLATPAVVVCPASVKWHWESQASQHIGMSALVLSGRKAPKVLHTKHNLIIVNYDILDAWLPALLKLGIKTVGLDECQKIKNKTTKAYKCCKKLCKNVEHILALSGTPLTNRAAELFTTINLLWPDEFPKFWKYTERYCNRQRRPWGWDISGSVRLKELHRRLKNLGMIRRLKTEVLKDLPAKVRNIIPVDIERAKEYQLAQDDFVKWWRVKKMKRKIRAQQITKIGYLMRLAAELKLPAVIQLIQSCLQETDEKLVVFCSHYFMLDALQKQFKKLSVRIDGRTSSRKRKLAIDTFIHSSKTRLILGNILAMGTGTDGLQRASKTAIIAELPWTPGDLVQAEDRVFRIGQKASTMIHFPVAKGTIEEKLITKLQNKQDNISKTLDGRSGKKNGFNIYDLLAEELTKGNRPKGNRR